MSIYTLTISDIKGKPVDHLPITLKTRFRSLERVMAIAKKRHAENRSVVIVEHSNDGCVYSWEMEAGIDRVIFSDEQ